MNFNNEKAKKLSGATIFSLSCCEAATVEGSNSVNDKKCVSSERSQHDDETNYEIAE